MEQIRIGTTVYTRSDAFCPWAKTEYVSLRGAKKANRKNLSPCLKRPAQLPAQIKLEA